MLKVMTLLITTAAHTVKPLIMCKYILLFSKCIHSMYRRLSIDTHWVKLYKFCHCTSDRECSTHAGEASTSNSPYIETPMQTRTRVSVNVALLLHIFAVGVWSLW